MLTIDLLNDHDTGQHWLGMYRLRINSTKRGESHCWLKTWGGDKPLNLCGKPSEAQKFSLAEAEQVGQAWADWLVASGYGSSAKLIEIVPAHGGMARGWRAKL